MANASVNKAILFGRLVNAPRFHEKSGACQAMIETVENSKDGKAFSQKTFVVGFGEIGEYMKDLLPGTKVFVEGKLQTRETSDKKKITEVVVRHIEV